MGAATTTYQQRLDRRDSSSASPTSSSTSCTGSKQECTYPTDHSTGVMVGVAVAIPVFVIIVVLAAILFVVYRRSKKEAKDDHDPEFDGDGEYIPDLGSFPISGSSGELKEVKDDYSEHHYFSRPPSSNPFNSSNSIHTTHTRPMDPFQLPQGMEGNSLRNFAMQVQGQEPSGYQLATRSRNGSQFSLVPEQHMQLAHVKSPANYDDVFDGKSGIQVAGLPVTDEMEKTQEHEYHDDHREDQEKNEDVVYSLSPDEEEDIKRMKSIYQVYLDRKNTVKGGPVADEPDYTAATDTKLYSNDLPELMQSQNIQEQLAADIETTAHLSVNERHPRIASSIYSEVPQQSFKSNTVQQQYPYQFQQQQQYPYPQYPVPEYTQPYYIPSQQHHPQTLESINELPTPAQLGNSSSVHSLTSFSKPAKRPQLSKLQSVRINGTAVNPMDHPEIFYSNTGDTYSSYQQQLPSGQQTGNNVLLPYQMRQSVVMTDPRQLTLNSIYKPAGSFRNVSASSRNNSLMSNMTPQQMQQQQQINSRVSGLLEETDIVQPPTIGDILPHSNSSDDLRRQLGQGHDYGII